MSGIILALFATAFLLSYSACYTWLTPVRLTNDVVRKRKLVVHGWKLVIISLISFGLGIYLFLFKVI